MNKLPGQFYRKLAIDARSHAGVTLVETVMAFLCMSILMGPIFYIFQSGSRISLEGKTKAEITLEARRIIKQVHDDLKFSVFVLDYSKVPSDKPSYYFSVILGGNSETAYSVLRFPLHGAVGDSIESGGQGAWRKPVRVTYSLRKDESDKPYYSLYRQEGGNAPTALSKRVNFFEIRENFLAPAKTSWIVTLQLVDVVKPSFFNDANFRKLMATGDTSIKATERRLLERSRGVQIADFYDVASSDYYSFFRKSGFIPNWQTLLKGS